MPNMPDYSKMVKGSVWWAVDFILPQVPMEVFPEGGQGEVLGAEQILRLFGNGPIECTTSVDVKPRPVLLLRDGQESRVPDACVAMITSMKEDDERRQRFYEQIKMNQKKAQYYLSEKRQGVDMESFVSLLHIHHLPKKYLIRRAGLLAPSEMQEIDRRLYAVLELHLDVCEDCREQLHRGLVE
jgi:mRNA-degrading endonuclease toxin of MazEF toxin-antitoxin module